MVTIKQAYTSQVVLNSIEAFYRFMLEKVILKYKFKIGHQSIEHQMNTTLCLIQEIKYQINIMLILE
jgi:hypothetical protein